MKWITFIKDTVVIGISYLGENFVKAIKILGYVLLFGVLAYSLFAYIAGTNKEKDTRFVAEAYFETINEYRLDNNRIPLDWDEYMFQIAVEHSEWMDETNNLEHSRNGYYEVILKDPGGHLDMSKYMPEELILDLDEYENGEIVERKTYPMINPWIESELHNEILLSDDIYYGVVGVSGDYVTFLAR